MSDEVEKKLLKMAEKEFLSKGFEGARTSVIAEKAGVTHAMFHYYFRTKEQLFNRICEEKMGSIVKGVFAAFEAEGRTLLDRICNGVGTHFDLLAKEPQLAQFALNTLLAQPERMAFAKKLLAEQLEPRFNALQLEINAQAEAGMMVRVAVPDLIYEIIALNFFAFISLPIQKNLLPNLGIDPKTLLQRRREQNIMTIRKSLQIEYNPVINNLL